MKFDIGDKVKVIKAHLANKEKYIGSIFTIRNIDPNGFGVYDEPHYGIEESEMCSYIWLESELQLVEPSPQETPKTPEQEDTPMRFKVGDRVKVLEDARETKQVINEVGTVIYVNEDPNPCYLIEFDNDINGHDGLISEVKGKKGHCWWCNEDSLTLSHVEPLTPIQFNITINVNTTNNYDNSCWYCRKGGVVDLYFAGRFGICPKCGRACNSPTPDTSNVPVKPLGSKVIEFKPKKKNEPLTVAELEALPEGARVFTVWYSNGEPDWSDPKTTWRTKEGNKLKLSNGHVSIKLSGCFQYWKAYLEKPERPKQNEDEIELPF